MKNRFSDVMAFRHACKIFDENRKIDDESMHYILEVGRTSPSSFGQEAWKFLLITNEELKEKLRPKCWNQPQITSCSHLVVVLAGIDCARPSSGIPAKRFARREYLTDKEIEGYINLYSNFLADTLSSDEKTYAWTSKQTYIALANMMSAGAYIGIDSCPIEGFEKEEVEKILGLDTSKFQVAVLVAFGYRVNEQPTQQRLPFDEVVEFIK